MCIKPYIISMGGVPGKSHGVIILRQSRLLSQPGSEGGEGDATICCISYTVVLYPRRLTRRLKNKSREYLFRKTTYNIQNLYNF